MKKIGIVSLLLLSINLTGEAKERSAFADFADIITDFVYYLGHTEQCDETCNSCNTPWKEQDMVTPRPPRKYSSKAARHAHAHANSSANAAPNYSQRQVEEYVCNLVQSLRADLKPLMTTRQFELFMNRITAAIQQSQFSNKDLVDQLMMSAVIEFVEEVAFESAYAQTNSKDIAQRIAESMRNNVMALIAKYAVINASIIKPFIGSALQQAISYELAQLIPQEPQYPSEDCCICYDTLTPASRVFLSPCGHDLCASCARDMFVIRNNDKCPLCRTVISKTKLQTSLNKLKK